MRKWGNSIRKRLVSILANPKKAKKLWGEPYWQDIDGIRDVSCQNCPKFDGSKNICTVPFGTPLRKCVVASIEAHLYDANNKNVLELGFGRLSMGKNLVKRSGGTWTGVEPLQPKSRKPRLGRGCYGHTEDIPFPDETFDLVYGIQSFEHWGQKSVNAAREPSDYKNCLNEILRVLKPGGSIYLDAPIHLHGHEMFIMGDVDRILSYFPEEHWSNVSVERWRYNYQPLERYAPFEKLFDDWKQEIVSYSEDEIAEAKSEPIWLFAITAEKRLG